MKAPQTSQEIALRVMASNTFMVGAGIYLLLLLRVPPLVNAFFGAAVGAFFLARWQGRYFLNTFFADQLLPIGTIGAFLWLAMVACMSDPFWLQGFWLIVGAGFVGLSTVLSDRKDIVLETGGNDITPPPFLTHPTRWNRLLSLSFGWFLWSVPEAPLLWQAPLTLLFTTMGITGVGNWRLSLHPGARQLRIHLSGMPGLAGSYLFGFDQFQRILLVKLQEGGVSWLQLTGRSEEVTLPGILLDYASGEGELTEVLKQRFPLARQEATRDSLQMMGILIPQGIGILLGFIWILLGSAVWWILELPTTKTPAITLLLGGSCLVSPVLARSLFEALIPGSVSTRSRSEVPLWEIGVAFVVIALAQQSHVGVWALVTVAFLCWGIGGHMWYLVRSVPIRQEH